MLRFLSKDLKQTKISKKIFKIFGIETFFFFFALRTLDFFFQVFFVKIFKIFGIETFFFFFALWKISKFGKNGFSYWCVLRFWDLQKKKQYKDRINSMKFDCFSSKFKKQKRFWLFSFLFFSMVFLWKSSFFVLIQTEEFFL